MESFQDPQAKSHFTEAAFSDIPEMHTEDGNKSKFLRRKVVEAGAGLLPKIDKESGLPVVGSPINNTVLFMNDRLQFITSAYTAAKKPDGSQYPFVIVPLTPPTGTAYIVTTYEAYRDMHTGAYADGTVDKAKFINTVGSRIFGDSIVSQGKDDYAKFGDGIRRTLSIREVAHTYFPIMQEIIKEVVSSWKPGEVIDMDTMAKFIASEIAIKSLFSNSGGEMLQRMRILFAEANSAMGKRVAMPLPEIIPTKTNREYLRTTKEIDKMIREFILKREQMPKEGWPKDLLTLLMEKFPVKSKDGKSVLHPELLGNVRAFMFAGAETTESLTKTVLFHLGTNKQLLTDVMSQLRELMEKKGYRSVEEIAHTDLKDLNLITGSIKEAGRMVPPAVVSVRDVMKDFEYNGYKLKKGRMIFVSPWALNYDPSNYSDPQTFNPRRESDRRKILTFGYGPRNCPGQNFAESEVAELLISLLGNFPNGFETVDPEEVKLKIGASMSYSGVKIKLN